LSPPAQVDLHVERGRAQVVIQGQLAGPPTHLDGEIVTRLRSEPVTERVQDNARAIRPELVTTSFYGHGSTVGHMWGDVQ